VAVVVDRDEYKGRKLAEHVGAAYVRSVEALPGAVDAAIVAVPTESHAEVGVVLLENGLDVLMEKPIAATVEEAKGVEHQGEPLSLEQRVFAGSCTGRAG
jgi:predicted dehydrogenase